MPLISGSFQRVPADYDVNSLRGSRSVLLCEKTMPRSVRLGLYEGYMLGQGTRIYTALSPSLDGAAGGHSSCDLLFVCCCFFIRSTVPKRQVQGGLIIWA